MIETPYTMKELESMTTEQLLQLPKKCPRLYPYCLIGLPIDYARKRMDDWCKPNGINAQLLTPGQGCSMNVSINYYWCELDEHNIVCDISSWRDFDS